MMNRFMAIPGKEMAFKRRAVDMNSTEWPAFLYSE
jgi:hypothetical protein